MERYKKAGRKKGKKYKCKLLMYMKRKKRMIEGKEESDNVRGEEQKRRRD